MSLPKVTIYTDGSCKPNPGSGGWGAVIIFSDDDNCEKLQGRESETTNNRMELMAPIEALKSLKDPHEVTLVTDSTYLKNGITVWIHDWKSRGWVTREKQPVKNRDLWNALHEEMQRHRISWEWVKGHAGNKWNELADHLAASGREYRALPLENNQAVHIFIGITWKHSTGNGAWSLVLNYRHHMKILGGRVENTTANRLYIETAAKGLKSLKRPLPVYLYTSSGYLKDGVQSWLPGWMRRNWVTRDGKEVSNKTQWRELKSLLDSMDVQIFLAEKDKLPCLLQEAKELAREYEKV